MLTMMAFTCLSDCKILKAWMTCKRCGASAQPSFQRQMQCSIAPRLHETHVMISKVIASTLSPSRQGPSAAQHLQVHSS